MPANNNSDNRWKLHDAFMKLHKKAFPHLINANQQKEGQLKWKEIRNDRSEIDRLMSEWSLKADKLKTEGSIKSFFCKVIKS
jgi:hypothetical protein